MKIAIVCANYGGFDLRKEIPIQNFDSYGVHYFHENNSPFPFTALDNRMKAKYFKLQAHKILPDFDAYIWIDGAFKIKSENFVSKMISELHGNDIAVTKHPDRNCIFAEADFVLSGLNRGSKYFQSRYAASRLELEISRYQSFQKGKGLYACGLFARWNNDHVNNFFDKWWERCLQYSAFDQLSFPILAEENNIKINPLTFSNYLDNEFYKIEKHGK